MKTDAQFDAELKQVLDPIERIVLVKHREKYHPLDWLNRAEACGLITSEQAAKCREAAAPLIARLQALEGVR